MKHRERNRERERESRVIVHVIIIKMQEESKVNFYKTKKLKLITARTDICIRLEIYLTISN